MNNSAADSDRLFAGSMPEFYERYLVPLIFEPYAADIAARVARLGPSRILEVAAGTGVATRQLARVLRTESILATDLNQPMLDHARSLGTERPIEWRQADAMQLPFTDQSFDAVVCQFGVMFLPDKAKGFSEAWRVLRPGGHFVFNVWDRIEENEFADVVTRSLEEIFPNEPPRFLARVPHGYHDRNNIVVDLEGGGFTRAAEFTTLAERSWAESPQIPALAYCQGTPLRNEIEVRGAARLSEATNIAAQAIASRFGSGAVAAKIQAHVIVVER